jgi:hypothetical protein
LELVSIHWGSDEQHSLGNSINHFQPSNSDRVNIEDYRNRSEREINQKGNFPNLSTYR